MRDDRVVSVTRVLLIEDHELFRGYIRAVLEEHPDFRLVSEAVNGLEAVHKCLELQPDMVLMDIGLPGLSGIEAARRIRAIVPACKIVFLTQETSVDVVLEALNLGAAGYVTKFQAASDLIPALIAARDGRRFVSSSVRGFDSGVRRKLETLAGKGQRETPASPRSRTRHHHEIHFYPDDASFVAGFASCVESSLKAHKAVLAIIAERHRVEILQALEAGGIDVNVAIAEGHFVPVDVAGVWAEFMVNDRVDPVRALRACVAMLETLMKSNPGVPVSVCGEGASMLLALGNGEAALQIERTWDEMAVRYGIDVFCPYVMDSFPQDKRTLDQIRAAHSMVAVH